MRRAAIGSILLAVLLVAAAAAAAEHRLGGIIYVPEGTEWGVEVERGMRDGAAEAGAVIDIRRHAFDLARETELIAEFIAADVEAIVFPAVRSLSSIYMVHKAFEAGVVIVCFNTCVAGSEAEEYVSAFYQSDQFEMGYQTGAYLAQWIAERGVEPRVAIVQCELFEACYRRGQGFRAALADAGVEWTLVASREALDQKAGRETVVEILRDLPEVNIVWADNGENTVGAVEGVRLAGRQGKVFVFGSEMGLSSARMLLDDDDVLQSLSSMMTYELARDAVRGAVRILEGGELGRYLHILGSPFHIRRDRDEIERFIAVREGAGAPQ